MFARTRPRLGFASAFVLVLLAWLVYSLLFVLYLPEPWASLLGFLPGLLALGALALAGFYCERAYLRIRRPTPAGLAMLAALFLPMIPVVVSGFLQAGWAGWDWRQALLYAPASGVAQELYFRAALLPALEWLLDRPRRALLLSSLMFSLFHAGMFTVAPPAAAVSALLVTFLAGLGWGWQVQRDRTVLWAMLHHALLQLILRLFDWM